MIYLIGGSPRSGKTIFSKMLAQKLNCNLISIDDLRKKEIKKLSRKEAFKSFPFEKIYKNNDDFFQKYSPKEILEWDLKDAQALWLKIDENIKKNLKKESTVVIEGVQLFPEFIKRYKNNSLIKLLLFYKKDEKLMLEGFLRNKDRNDWLMNNTNNPKTFNRAAKTYSFFGKYLEKESKKYDIAAINTEKDFNKVIKRVLKNKTLFP